MENNCPSFYICKFLVSKFSTIASSPVVISLVQVQLELRETTEERDRLLVELKEKTAKLEDQIGMTY